ncbi:hypothetical protein L208DRAFT_1270971, partial [Tricholoma matsutake]
LTTPVTFDHMLSLCHHFDLSNTRDAAVWVVACKAFWDCTRLGELLPKSTSSFDTTRNITRGCLLKRGVAANGRHFLTFKIPYSKTRQHAGDWIKSVKYSDLVNPVSAFEHHLHLSCSLPLDALLFAYQTTAGWAYLMREHFMSHCCEIWRSAGLESLLGHGFCISGTTYSVQRANETKIIVSFPFTPTTTCLKL